VSVELAFDRVNGPRPQRTIVFLHGILGSGRNLRSIARRYIAERPDWNAWLLDLRGHGGSPKGTPNPSLEAVAADVVSLAKTASPPVVAIVGHSFGGKVALDSARLDGLPALEHVVVIDSVPGGRERLTGDDNALAIVDLLESLPRGFASRSDFVEVMLARGTTRALAEWLAQSVVQEAGEFRFNLNLREIRALIDDYLARDLWPVVEHPPDAIRVHLVIGQRSVAYSKSDRERAAQIAASNHQVTVDVLPAGHWVHIDDPGGLLRLLLERID